MYSQNTPNTRIVQERSDRQRGFTLVEIMIVIVIIILLTQLGNIGGLFKARESGELSTINAEMLGVINETKLDALLGKTHEGNIVKSRSIGITPSTNGITFTKGGVLADDSGVTPAISPSTKTWSLPNLLTSLHYCDQNNVATPISAPLSIEFRGDKLSYIPPATSQYHHIILQTKLGENTHELHVDRRTGLTFDRPGDATVSCNT